MIFIGVSPLSLGLDDYFGKRGVLDFPALIGLGIFADGP